MGVMLYCDGMLAAPTAYGFCCVHCLFPYRVCDDSAAVAQVACTPNTKRRGRHIHIKVSITKNTFEDSFLCDEFSLCQTYIPNKIPSGQSPNKVARHDCGVGSDTQVIRSKRFWAL